MLTLELTLGQFVPTHPLKLLRTVSHKDYVLYNVFYLTIYTNLVSKVVSSESMLGNIIWKIVFTAILTQRKYIMFLVVFFLLLSQDAYEPVLVREIIIGDNLCSDWTKNINIATNRNIRLFDILSNFTFAISETKRNYKQ